MSLETLASVCSGLEAEFSRENTTSLEMGTVETRSRKPQAPKEKTLKGAFESLTGKRPRLESALESCVGVINQEHGVTSSWGDDMGQGVAKTEISVNKRGFSGEGEIGLVESSSLKMTKSVSEVETRDGRRSGTFEKLEDGVNGRTGEKGLVEENGVSLDERENENEAARKVDSIDVPVEDMSDNHDGEVEDMGSEFSVGDFVWGKIRSHPWWPGQIYDPSYASDYASKIKVKGRHLVAYFGDGTFAWCPPSELKPFEENFDEMSKQSSKKTFVSAVQQATDEVGRLLESKLTCSCVPKASRTGLGQPVAENAGIKPGILAPEGETKKLASVLAVPSELLAELKRIAQLVYVTNVFELRVLRSRLSALYRAKGVHRLPEYHDPEPISGLDDTKKSVKVPTQGPFEDWPHSPMGFNNIQTIEPSLESSPVTPENRKTQRRKQRSIADLIGSNKDAHTRTKDRETATEGKNSEKRASPSGAMKRKGREELNSREDSSLTSLMGKGKRTRSSLSPVSTSIISNFSSVKKDSRRGKEEIKEGLSSKVRTKKKGVNFEKNDGESKIGTRSGSVSRKLNLNIDSLKSDDSLVKLQMESPRERKKSKYLSPPFTNLNSGKRKRDTETEQVSTEERMEEEIAMAADKKEGSPQIFKCSSNKTLKDKVSTEPVLGGETSHDSSPNLKTPILDQNKIIGETKVNVSTEELLSQVRSAAVNRLTPSGKKSVEMVVDFMSLFRNSVYRNGSNYKQYSKLESRRKRKNLDSESGSQMEHQKHTAEKSSENEPEGKKVKNNRNVKADEPKEKQVVKTPDAKSGRRKPKKATETPVMKTTDTVSADVKSARRKPKKATETPESKKTDKETVEEKASPAALFVTFGPGSSLPTKVDLIRMYGKYGELDETETEMFYNNFCARVSFLKSSDAEVAFNDSQNASPFGSASVSFRLRYHSGAFKTRELSEISRQRAATPLNSNVKTPKKHSKSQQANGGGSGGGSDLSFIKQKLEKISSMLEDSNDKVSPKMKYKLRGEIKGLLEKVGTMVGGSSS